MASSPRRAHLEPLDADALVAFDRMLERKLPLYNVDRQEIQEVTDGSDDGFLYARGFIVALGELRAAVDKTASQS